MKYRTNVLDSEAKTIATTPAMAIPINAPMIAARWSFGRSLHFCMRLIPRSSTQPPKWAAPVNYENVVAILADLCNAPVRDYAIFDVA